MRAFLIIAAALAVCPSLAAAQQSMMSTPVVIQSGAAGVEGVMTTHEQIILQQQANTIRAAMLDEPIAAPTGSGRQAQGFRAGEALFGIYDEYNSWAYCALRRSFFASALTCYEDTDNDGKLDLSLPSGAPFGGVPFFVFPEHHETRPLAAPAAFHRIPYAQGPSIDAALQVTLNEPFLTQGVTRPAIVVVHFGFIADGHFLPLNQPMESREADGRPLTIDIGGARIEFSGEPRLGAFHYRIVRPLPSSVQRVQLARVRVTRPPVPLTAR